MVMQEQKLADKPGAWVDLALTLPIFIAYHLGVIFLNVHNADGCRHVRNLEALAAGSRGLYILFTLAIGTVFTGVFAWLGRGEAFRTSRNSCRLHAREFCTRFAMRLDRLVRGRTALRRKQRDRK